MTPHPSQDRTILAMLSDQNVANIGQNVNVIDREVVQDAGCLGHGGQHAPPKCKS
jgi:hypothetical protein